MIQIMIVAMEGEFYHYILQKMNAIIANIVILLFCWATLCLALVSVKIKIKAICVRERQRMLGAKNDMSFVSLAC